MYRFKFISYLLLLLLFNGMAHGKPIDIDKYTETLPKGASLSLAIKPINSRTSIINYHGDKMSLPASTQKVITALAAMLQLGEDYRFTTSFETNGTIKNQQLDGDLIIRFSGDPTFKRQQLKQMIQNLTLKGIKTINGKVLINTAVFSSHDRAPGWSWNNMTSCYNTAPSATIFDGNCFYATLTPGKNINDIASVKTPAHYPIKIISEVISVDPKNKENRYCELDMVVSDHNQYRLTGCVKTNSNQIPLVFAIQDSHRYARDIIANEFSNQKITIKQGIEQSNSDQEQGKIVLESHHSESLRELLTRMMKRSDNLIADTIFRTIGREYFSVSGTWRSASDAVKNVLRQKAHIDMENTIIKDGSGLSRQNLISADKMLEILQYIANNDKKLNMISMFPTSGVDGTLLNRHSLRGKTLKGQVVAKTGMLDGVYNLAGFITNQQGQQFAFVQFISGYSYTPKSGENKRGPLLNFENRLYNTVFNYKPAK